MIFTFWLFLIALIGFAVTLFVGKWWLILLGYLIVGTAWTGHDSLREPLSERLVGHMTRGGTLYLLLLWPYVAARAAKKRWSALRSPSRFRLWEGHVRWKGHLEDPHGFASLQDAIAIAQRKAAELKEPVFIFDTARFYWETMQQRWFNVFYTVDPSGKVERADRVQPRD